MSKNSTRILLIFFALLVISGFSYTVLKAEDLKEKQKLLKNISLENNDYANYRHQLLDEMTAEQEKNRKEMETILA